MTVTKVTQDATLDDLSAIDYRDIFTELRQNLSLDKLIAQIGSAYSKAAWNRYEKGDYDLTRTMRNELRLAVGLPALPETVADAVASRTSPDASVWVAGDGTAGTVILVADGVKTTLHVNGVVSEVHETPCNPSNSSATPRKPLIRPVASKAQDERRKALKTSWRDVIEAGLKSLEEK